MFILLYRLQNVNLKAQNQSQLSEFTFSLAGLAIMFLTRFILDLYYQYYYCMGQQNIRSSKLLMNSIYNSITVSVAVFLGYLLAIMMENPEIDKQILPHQKSWIRNISNHKNNFMLSTLFYFIAIIYTNPVTFEKKIISRNNMC